MTSWTATLRDHLDHAWSRRRLAACTRLGERARVRGFPVVGNSGQLFIGDDFRLSSVPARSHIIVLGKMSIGDRVRIGAGAAISCSSSIEIESDVTIGEFAMILDSDFHVADDVEASPVPRPIRISAGARLGHRVVVLPGSTIGTGVVVKAGSVVSGDVPDNSVIEGNPARVRLGRSERTDDGGDDLSRDIPALVMQVLGLSNVPDLEAGPAEIASWDSLGALRLIVALEETFDIALAEDQLRTAGSIHELVRQVEAAQRRSRAADTRAQK